MKKQIERLEKILLNPYRHRDTEQQQILDVVLREMCARIEALEARIEALEKESRASKAGYPGYD
jgi:hypothetical protein